MTTAEATATELQTIVRPFAALLYGPGNVLPTSGQFNDLQAYYGACPHPDFEHPADYEPWGKDLDHARPIRLPFALSLGLHPAGPKQVQSEESLATFAAFASQKQLAYLGDPDIENRYRRRRAASVLAATILDTGVNPPYRLFPTQERTAAAIDFARHKNLLSRTNARLLSRAVELSTHH